jgi:AcrR family transcriptional regulator
MNEKPAGAENRIIQATIDCIEMYGISGATNRRIAEVAGVNIAAINYYFRSKDALIQRCMEMTLKNAFDLSDFPPMPGVAAQERCAAILMDIIQGGHHFPGITRAHFFNLFAQGQPDPLLEKHTNRFIDELAVDLQNRGCSLPLDELKIALVQLMSAAIMAILAPTLFAHQRGLDLHDPDMCHAYVTRLVERLLS